MSTTTYTIAAGKSNTNDLATVKAKFTEGDAINVVVNDKNGKCLGNLNVGSKNKCTYNHNSAFMADVCFDIGKFYTDRYNHAFQSHDDKIRYFTLCNDTDVPVSLKIRCLSDPSEEVFTRNCSKFIVAPNSVDSFDLATVISKEPYEASQRLYFEVKSDDGKSIRTLDVFYYDANSDKESRFILEKKDNDWSIKYDGIKKKVEVQATPIRGIQLYNDDGWFVANIRVKYGNGHSYNVNQDITRGHSRTFDIAETKGKIKDGETIWLETVVEDGTNNKAVERFIYRQSSDYRAIYSISGTIRENTQYYKGLSKTYTHEAEPVRFFELQNEGAFYARIKIHSASGSYTSKHYIPALKYHRVDLVTLGKFKDGEEVWMETLIKGGHCNTTEQRFTYSSDSDAKACFRIEGTTTNNSDEYVGTYKIGVLPHEPITEEKITAKIDAWENKKNTPCAWTGIKKEFVVEALRTYADRYFGRTKEYSEYFQPTEIEQGPYPFCGPLAIMFYLAKLNFSTFIDTIIQLYEDGHLMGYRAPKKLRELGKLNKNGQNNIDEYFESKCSHETRNTNWMFLASLAQKEAIFDIKLQNKLDELDS
ncbi:MAG: hypothetical protein Q4G10_02765 [Bacteroidia bacterium]|nr:hypothetical protein [Bacteroidia bacterium]